MSEKKVWEIVRDLEDERDVLQQKLGRALVLILGEGFFSLPFRIPSTLYIDSESRGEEAFLTLIEAEKWVLETDGIVDLRLSKTCSINIYRTPAGVEYTYRSGQFWKMASRVEVLSILFDYIPSEC